MKTMRSFWQEMPLLVTLVGGMILRAPALKVAH
jgi:hypothetical protein